jgi:hypothetical protein
MSIPISKLNIRFFFPYLSKWKFTQDKFKGGKMNSLDFKNSYRDDDSSYGYIIVHQQFNSKQTNAKKYNFFWIN